MVIKLVRVTILLWLISTQSSCHAKLTSSGTEVGVYRGYSIDWLARERGQECRDKCYNRVEYVGAFCSSFFNFAASAACTFVRTTDPLVCALLEGPFSGLAGYCATDFFDLKFCNRCDEAYSIADILFMTEDVNMHYKKVMAPLKNITSVLKNLTSNFLSSTTEMTEALKSSATKLKLSLEWEKTLLRVRFLTYLFSRIDSTNLDKEDQISLKQYYLSTAIDKTHQNGLISLFKLLHSLLVGQAINVFGTRASSILLLNQDLCEAKTLMSLKTMIFSLISQIHFVYQSDPDIKDLRLWIGELLEEQRKVFQQVCHAGF